MEKTNHTDAAQQEPAEQTISRRRLIQAGVALAVTPAALSGVTPFSGLSRASAQTNEPDPDPPVSSDDEDTDSDDSDNNDPDNDDQDDNGSGDNDVDDPDAGDGDSDNGDSGDSDEDDEEPEDVLNRPIEVNGLSIPNKAYFPETGHHLSGDFLAHWLNNGDFTIYGFPITDPVIEDGREVQYFERARLEYWPEHAGSEWVIQGTLLGNWKAERIRSLPAFRPLPATEESTDERWVFPETRHSLTGGFLEYWLENGGVHVFGYPISEEFEEENEPPPAGDGQTYNVQYFERARMEWHPENEGTPFVVLLGHLGHEWAELHDVDRSPVPQDQDAVKFDAGVFSTSWQWVIRPHSGGWMGYVSTDALGIRVFPTSESERSAVIYHGRPVIIYGIVRGGDEIGIDTWYDLGGGRYVSAAYVSALVAPAPPQTFGGTWVDVNLTHFWAIAYENSTPVYAAIITAGRGDRTPKGVFEVQSRVANETMDSATVGFPEGHPEHYYLENVLYTQYFAAGGYALHGNYWTPEPSFGQFSSNGCVGLLNGDAEYFWNWLWFGSAVSIHF